MKKINTKIVALAILILSFVAASSLAVKEVVSPGVYQGDQGSGGGG